MGVDHGVEFGFYGDGRTCFSLERLETKAGGRCFACGRGRGGEGGGDRKASCLCKILPDSFEALTVLYRVVFGVRIGAAVVSVHRGNLVLIAVR